MIGIFMSVLLIVAVLVIKALMTMVFRFDITNSLLVSGLVQLLTIEQKWSSLVRWIIFFTVLALCLVAQHSSKIMRFVFGLFSTAVIGFFGYIWIEYASREEQLLVTFVCLAVGAFLNYSCWARSSAHAI